MKGEQTTEEKIRNHIIICPKCGARKNAAWSSCDICGKLISEDRVLFTEFAAEPNSIVPVKVSTTI
jgi:hypothetical protein